MFHSIEDFARSLLSSSDKSNEAIPEMSCVSVMKEIKPCIMVMMFHELAYVS